VTIIVATFGDISWYELAGQRAMPSARTQGCPVLRHHGESLHEARNTAAGHAQTEWLLSLKPANQNSERWLCKTHTSRKWE
jgi:hypothetical protein